MTSRRLGLLTSSLALVASGAFVTSVSTVSAATSSRPLIPLHVSALSVDFSSKLDGWILGTGPCGVTAQCLLLERTTNGGTSWSRISLPAALRSNVNFQIDSGDEFFYNMSNLSVRFENPRDGWISGPMTGRVVAPGVSNGIINLVVWSTHNGGMSWSSSALPDLGGASTFFDLESSSTAVYVLGVVASTNRAVVDFSPVGTDRWTHSSLVPMSLPAGGSFPYGAITLAGTHGWLTEGNDRGASGSAQLNVHGQWVPWKAPCASVGYTMAYPEASSPTHLVVACQIGGFGESPVVGGPPGASLESTWLRISTNGGTSFRWGPEIGKTYADSAAILAAPSASTMLADMTNTSTHLMASFDGGNHWSRVFHGDVLSLMFVTPTDGYGLVRVSNTNNEAIETVDGGHAWTIIAD